MKITLNNVLGFVWAMQATRLSYGMRGDSKIGFLIEQESVGPDDYRLACKLILRGPSHSKFLRTIVVWVTITAPRYWWCQFDTYKVGTTALSQSTMHTIMSRSLTQEDFEICHHPEYLEHLNELIEIGDFTLVKAMLPEGFIQTRMVCLNYQVLRTMYHQRKSHRLAEWGTFCNWVGTLPYSEFITM